MVIDRKLYEKLNGKDGEREDRLGRALADHQRQKMDVHQKRRWYVIVSELLSELLDVLLFWR